MTLGYLLLAFLEEIFFIKTNFDLKELIVSLSLFTIVAVVEETLLRGYILRNLMNSFNKYIALITSSILFSLMHSFNPNVDLFSLFNLFLAGIVLGLSYIYTKGQNITCDANMRELKQTGFMSNRGRQNVASYLIHEMALDWRLGARWFEHCLIDYDAASNYGNWNYLAGNGHDPRGQRHFDIDKQAASYDPDGQFQALWLEP